MTIASTGGFTTQQIKCIDSPPWDGFFAEIKKQGKLHPYMPPHILNRVLNAVFGPDGWEGPIIIGKQGWHQWQPMKNYKGEENIWLTSEVTIELRLKYRNEEGHLTGDCRRIQATSGHMLAVNNEYNVPQMIGHLLQGAVTKAMRAACKEIGTIFGSAVLKERKDVQGRPVQWRSLCVNSFKAIPWPSLPGIDSAAHAESEFVAQAQDFAADDFDGADEDAAADRAPQHVEPQAWSEPAPHRPAERKPEPRRWFVESIGEGVARGRLLTDQGRDAAVRSYKARGFQFNVRPAQPDDEEYQRPAPGSVTPEQKPSEPQADEPIRWFVEYVNGDEHGKFTTNIDEVRAALEAKGFKYTWRQARPGDQEYRRPRADSGSTEKQGAPPAPEQTEGETLRDAAVALIRGNPGVMVGLFQEVTGKKTAAIGTLSDEALGTFIEAAHAHDSTVPA